MKQNITKLQPVPSSDFASLHPPDQPLLETKSLTELYETDFVFGQPITEELLFPGVYLLAGDSKIGKSFLVSQLAFHVATGTKIWERQTWKSTVLYLALEDQFSRIQQRMYRMFGTTETEDLHFAVSAKTPVCSTLHNRGAQPLKDRLCQSAAPAAFRHRSNRPYLRQGRRACRSRG